MTFSGLTARTHLTSKYSSRQDNPVSGFILHHCAGTSNEGNENLLTERPDYEVSANYLLRNDTQLIGLVPEEYRAWTTGWDADKDKITMETVNTTGAPNWEISWDQAEKIAQLLADCSRRYGWGPIVHGENFFVHQDFFATECPGPTVMAMLPNIIPRANELLGGAPQPTPDPGPSPAPGQLEVDGDLGPLTTAALQRVLAVGDDGELGPVTNAALQQYLNDRGVNAGPVDAEWGPQTTKALQTLLSMKGYSVVRDGVLGPETISALQRALNDGAL